MSLFCLKTTQDRSWQDRTINIEVMMAPARSQLLYNKHKGLRTKFQQENCNLEREKSSYLKGFKTEQRLMERRKEVYSKRRNDIILRRSSGDSRRRTSLQMDPGRASAPPRLEETAEGSSVFLTQINKRDSKSADARTKSDGVHVSYLQRPLTTPHLAPPITPEVTYGGVSPGVSTRSHTPGKPFLERSKSVRFNNLQLDENPVEQVTAQAQELSIDERIQRFMDDQDDFNKRKVVSASSRDGVQSPDNKVLLARRYSAVQVNMKKLENAFDEFCSSNTTEGLQRLVKFATKMKAHVRTARNSSVIPTMASLKGARAFRGLSKDMGRSTLQV